MCARSSFQCYVKVLPWLTFISVVLPNLFSIVIISSFLYMNSAYLWIQPLAHIRNWVATLYGLIVSLLGLWRFFTTSWLLQCTWWAHEWHVSTLTHRLWSKCLFSITMFFRDDNACTHEWSTDHFSECVERHAYSTYDKFLKLHEGKANLMGFCCLFIWFLVVEPGLVFLSMWCKAVSQWGSNRFNFMPSWFKIFSF